MNWLDALYYAAIAAKIGGFVGCFGLLWLVAATGQWADVHKRARRMR